MKLRDWMNQNAAVVTILAVLVLIAALAWIIVGATGGPDVDLPQQAWYYDVETGTLYPGELGLYPPIVAPSGGDGVLAKVYSCSDCGSESERRIAWLEKHPPKVKERLEEIKELYEAKERGEEISEMIDPSEQATLQDTKLLAKSVPDGEKFKWVKAFSSAGQKMKLGYMMACNEEGGNVHICNP